jgi:hypothetical protein
MAARKKLGAKKWREKGGEKMAARKWDIFVCFYLADFQRGFQAWEFWLSAGHANPATSQVCGRPRSFAFT